MNKVWRSKAPANIALVKYMGKEPGNQATNPSFSMTLANFCTEVEISEAPGASQDIWEPLHSGTKLKPEASARFLKFFDKLKTQEGIKSHFRVRSANNFPSDAGLASSASSFAALTMAAYEAFSAIQDRPLPDRALLANISRTGSGSSCRSFFSPWCAWEGEKVYKMESSLEPLIDMVVISESQQKKISSSQAHQMVRTSPLFHGRTARAHERFTKSAAALKTGDFKALAEIAWADMWDMHSLFHTSTPSFSYLAPSTIAVLRFAETFWEKHSYGPITTIDAGPNVHLLVKKSEQEKIRADLAQYLHSEKFDLEILESPAE
jgi:diphosphomevalonate decarboxylase